MITRTIAALALAIYLPQEPYTCNTYQHTPGTTTPPKRAHHAMVYDEANRRILLTSGSTPVDGGKSYTFFNDLWSFDGSGWTSQGTAGDGRSGIGLLYDSKKKKIVSLGGYSGSSGLTDLRVLESNEWKAISQIPDATIEPGFVYDAGRDRYIAFGGSKERGQVNATTWEWNGNEWKALNIACPAGRQAFAMVYDSKRRRTVLFGGMGVAPNELYNDTWEFDGTEWKLADTTGPSARLAMGYAYDSKRGLLIIFGGGAGKGTLNDTWAWDGTSWKKLADSGPSPRVMGYMAYDTHRDKVVLFGGRPGWPVDADDTWEWDGVKWSEVQKE